MHLIKGVLNKRRLDLTRSVSKIVARNGVPRISLREICKILLTSYKILATEKKAFTKILPRDGNDPDTYLPEDKLSIRLSPYLVTAPIATFSYTGASNL